VVENADKKRWEFKKGVGKMKKMERKGKFVAKEGKIQEKRITEEYTR
jgi:hypothetical protein